VDLLEEKRCILCDSDDNITVHTYPADYYPHDRFETTSWDGRLSIPLTIVRCTRCGLTYTRPSFTKEGLSKLYPEDLIDDSPSEERIARLFDPGNAKFNSLLRVIERHVPTPAVLVDIGSRYGVFPFIARTRYGYDALGIELNRASVELGRRRFDRLFHATIEDLPRILARQRIERVDVFVMDDVLEHLVDPNHDLEILRDLQPRGGHMFLRQMDRMSLGRKLFGRNWYYYSGCHMYYFDEPSISRLLDRHGYEVVALERPGFLGNLLRTLLFATPVQFHRRVKSRLFAGSGSPRRSYLTQRMRSANDMFLAVARKR
jgi:hypothetical protein